MSRTEPAIFRKPAPPPYKLDISDVKALNLLVCPWCGGYHTGLCRRVIEISYHPSGGVKHAVLREHWDTTGTTWLWELSEEA